MSRPSPSGHPLHLRVLVLADHYLPGHKAGGPIRTLAALAHYLGDDFEFRILTSDRDYGDEGPYAGVDPERWEQVGKAYCRYLAPQAQRTARVVRLIRATPHDVLYLNSLFSWRFGIRPIVLWRLGLLRRRPLVLAPRGQLDPAALALKRTKKLAFLAGVRAVGLYRGVIWHAADEREAGYIRRWFGDATPIRMAPNLSLASPAGEEVARAAAVDGPLRVVFMSRLSRSKNLDGALRILAGVRCPVDLDIYGPREDPSYWAECQRLIDRLPADVSARHRGVLPAEEVDRTLRHYDLFLLPTRSESFGHAILEALRAGCPVLISDRTPWRHLDARGAGWDLDLADEEAFRRVIERWAEATPAERERRAAAAQAVAAGVDHDPARISANVALFAGLADQAA